jgi:hypothetical protein
MLKPRLGALSLALSLIVASTGALRADGVSAVKSCENDNEPPNDVARLTLLPNGESRGSDTAAALIRAAREKAKAGRDDEAMQWAALCNFADPREQEAMKRDRTSVLQYLKQ